MNIMRKLRGGVAATNAHPNDGNVGDGTPGSPHTQLGLMHLKKLFSEYLHPPHPLSESERDDKLYNMLPLFCKVRIFGDKSWDTPKQSLTDKVNAV